MERLKSGADAYAQGINPRRAEIGRTVSLAINKHKNPTNSFFSPGRRSLYRTSNEIRLLVYLGCDLRRFRGDTGKSDLAGLMAE